ncbi:hypothetical protein KKE60_05060 [Patescibacteria group bacterium]|nr:hypothetical protein [Patescibacteria group bacterium]
MTLEAGPSGFRSPEQAEAIANILKHTSMSDSYDEKEQSTARTLSDRIKRYIEEGIILDKYITSNRGQETMLAEAFEIYVEVKEQ